jgi:2-haloacid dehalogenase
VARAVPATATLSNGHLALLVDLARHGDLRFDCLLSAELAHADKPAREVYRDLAGARNAGLRTAFVDRPLEDGPGSPSRADPEADVSTGDLPELAERLHGPAAEK